eukprot:46328_1
MSRMDWFSFRKQKLIAQLFFETIPQAILQGFLFSGFIQGRELTGITRSDLILSISAAILNSFIQIFRLKMESTAAQETFVQYSLHCITARFAWVPFTHKMIEFVQKNDGRNILNVNYHIQYELPLIKFLSRYLTTRNATEPLQIMYNEVQSRTYLLEEDEEEIEYQRIIERNYDINKKKVFGSIEYDFSNVTIKKLITTIKGLSKDRIKSKHICIKFGESLRLLGVRSIINLMQACHEKHIDLADIHQINWHQSFNHIVHDDIHKDPRLFSYTFDDNRKSLLISLYLTGYSKQENYFLLKSFVKDYDVPINTQDSKGDTIIHHMIRNKDFDAIYELFDVLKPEQRFNFNTQNDNGDTVLHEMVKQNNYSELKQLLNIIRLQSNTEINLKSFNNAGQSVLFLALEQDRTLIHKKIIQEEEREMVEKMIQIEIEKEKEEKQKREEHARQEEREREKAVAE